MTTATDFVAFGFNNQTKAALLEGKGASISVSKFILSVLAPGGSVLAQMPINGAEFEVLKTKQYDPSNMGVVSMANALEQTFDKALAQLTAQEVVGKEVVPADDDEAEASAWTQPVSEGGVETKAEAPVADSFGMAKAPVSGSFGMAQGMMTLAIPYSNPEVMKSTPVTPLTAGSLLLMRPVKGTSAGSKYWVVSGGQQARVALRVKSNFSISIRIEGATVSQRASLKAGGFFGGGAEGTTSTTHLSMHLDLKNWEDVYKVLGAVVSLLGMDELMTPLPPLKHLAGIKE